MGVSLMLFSMVLFLSAVSYNPIDLVEIGKNHNLFGMLGANLADFFLQYFGLATYFIIIFLIRWSFLIISKDK